MQVILFENMDKLGMQGDVVNVKGGFYRNYLGPQGKAVEATAHNLARLEGKRQKLQLEAERQRGEAKVIAKRLEEVSLSFTRRASDNGKLYGSVQVHEILDALNGMGFALERRQIVLKDSLKNTGEHDVRVRIIGTVDARVKVSVLAEAEPNKEEPAAQAPVAEAAEEEQSEDAAE